MGKARILSGGTGGLYVVEKAYDQATLDYLRTKYQAEIDQLGENITTMQQNVDGLQDAVDEISAAYLRDVDLYAEHLRYALENGTERPDQDVYLRHIKQLTKFQVKLAQANAKLSSFKLSRLEAQKSLDRIELAGDQPAQEAWCADFTEDASGEVASVEVPGEPQKLLVYPQALGEGSHTPTRDGQLMPREWMSPAQAYWNAAALPGWQRHRPTFRVGTLTAKSGNFGAVSIEDPGSTAAGLPTVPPSQQNLSGLPIEYMSCDGEVFEVGDRVLVEFQGRDWGAGRIIGFESNPKECIPYVSVSGYVNAAQETPTNWTYVRDEDDYSFGMPTTNECGDLVASRGTVDVYTGNERWIFYLPVDKEIYVSTSSGTLTYKLAGDVADEYGRIIMREAINYNRPALSVGVSGGEPVVDSPVATNSYGGYGWGETGAAEQIFLYGSSSSFDQNILYIVKESQSSPKWGDNRIIINSTDGECADSGRPEYINRVAEVAHIEDYREEEIATYARSLLPQALYYENEETGRVIVLEIERQNVTFVRYSNNPEGF